MLLSGNWLLCDDGVLRPVFRGRMEALDGSLLPVEFLADPGADRTVLCAAVVERLRLPTVPAPVQLGGVGGSTVTVLLSSAIHMQRDDEGTAVFRGQFAAFTQPVVVNRHALFLIVMLNAKLVLCPWATVIV